MGYKKSSKSLLQLYSYKKAIKGLLKIIEKTVSWKESVIIALLYIKIRNYAHFSQNNFF